VIRYSQPQQPVGIDWGNPLTRGLISAVSLDSNVGFGVSITKQNSPPSSATKKGIGVQLNGSNQSVSIGKAFASAKGTIFLLADIKDATASSKCIACQTSDAGGSNVGVGWKNNTFIIDGSAIGIALTTGINALVGTWDSSASNAAYVNGIKQGTAPGRASTGDANYPFTFGAFYYSGGRIFQHQNTPVLFFAFDRALSAVEIKQLSDNPWSIFQPVNRAIWVPVGGGNPVITSDTVADYLIREAVTSDTSASYAIRTSANADTSASYSIAAPVSSDTSASYAIRTSANADTSASYSIAAPITSDTSASYTILTAGAVTSDCAASYAIRGVVQSDASIAYELRGAVQSTLSGGYDIRQAVASDTSAAYAVTSLAVVTSDLAAAYAVTGVAGLSEADIAAIWAYGVRTITGPTAADIAAAVIALAQTTPIQADLRRVTGQAINGAGTEANPWGP